MPDYVPQVPQTPQVPTTPTVGTSSLGGQDKSQIIGQAAKARNPIFKPVYKTNVTSGSILTFQYTFYKHDPYPLVLCGGIWRNGSVVGINAHYLTYRYIKTLIDMYAGKNFSYQLIKGNYFVKNAFRTYKPQGIRLLKVLDGNFLKTILGSVRSFNPNEIEKIRQEIQKQLRQKMQQSADEIVQEYLSSMIPNPSNQKNMNTQNYAPQKNYGVNRPDGRNNPTDLRGI